MEVNILNEREVVYYKSSDLKADCDNFVDMCEEDCVVIKYPSKCNSQNNGAETDPVFSASPAAQITEENIEEWNGKQDAIGDLATIREGAKKGATALQKIPDEYVTETELEGKGYVTDISGKQDVIGDLGEIREGAQKGMTALQEEQYKGTVTGIKMNGQTKGLSGVVDLGTVLTEHQDISGKQDALVNGQNIKTINGESILGLGDIAINSESIDVTPLFTIGGTMGVRGMNLLQSHLYVQTKNYLSNVTVTVGSQLYLLEAQRRTSTADYGLVSVLSVVKFTDGVPECVDVVNADSKDTELLKRIQGTSEDSRASTDPFVRMDFRNIGELNAMLDTMHNDAEDRGKYMGVFRGTVDGGLYILENIVRNYANDVWEQCIRGCYNINSEKPKELIPSNKYRILRRSFYEGKWGAWENLFPTDIPTSGESYGKKVILLGDSQIALCKNGSLTLEGMLKEKLNTEVYNFAFAGSRWTLRSDSVASIYNPFSINEVVKALVRSYYADMDNVISNATDSDFITSYKNDYASTVERMKASNINLNYGEYVVVIACGGNDFKQKAPWGTVNDEVQSTLFGAMNSALKQLSYFSGVSVCVVSPTFAMMGGKTSDEETVGGKYRYEVGDAILAHARDAFHLPTFDMYRRGGRNKYNITSLCPDGVHPYSEAGVKSTVSIYEKILKSFGGSWPSIKTINGQSIVGSGDITISGGKAKIVAGASATSQTNDDAKNGNVYLNVVENSTVRSSNNIVGEGDISVRSDATGKIIIESRVEGIDVTVLFSGGGSGLLGNISDFITKKLYTKDSNGNLTYPVTFYPKGDSEDNIDITLGYLYREHITQVSGNISTKKYIATIRQNGDYIVCDAVDSRTSTL